MRDEEIYKKIRKKIVESRRIHAPLQSRTTPTSFLATHKRTITALTLLGAFIGFVLTMLFYDPAPKVPLDRKESGMDERYRAGSETYLFEKNGVQVEFRKHDDYDYEEDEKEEGGKSPNHSGPIPIN